MDSDYGNFMLGLISSYPILFIYQKWVRGVSMDLQHIFFVVTGISTAWYAIGIEYVIQHLFCILVNFTVLKICHGRYHSTGFLFVFQLGYYFFGYMMDPNGAKWTLHCVLCLRLIGHAIDVSDGTKHKDQLSKDQLELRLAEPPSLLETLSHCLFVGSYFAGPQHSLVKFRAALRRNHENGDMTGSVQASVRQLAKGVAFGLAFAAGTWFVPESYILSPEFGENGPILCRFWAIFLTQAVFYRLLCGLLISEGSCIMAGLTYNGLNSDGTIDWSGLKTVDLKEFHFATWFADYIVSYNKPTSRWVSHYIYKRLRFLGNKSLSYFLSLIFLAVWHGHYFGYYLAFILQFVIIWIENDIKRIISGSRILQNIGKNKRAVDCFKWIFIYFVVSVEVRLGFYLLTLENNILLWKACWPVFFLSILIWFLLRMPLQWILMDPTTKVRSSE